MVRPHLRSRNTCLQLPAATLFNRKRADQIVDIFSVAAWASRPFAECQQALYETTWAPPVPAHIEEPTKLLYAIPPPFIFNRSRDASERRLHNMLFLWVCLRRLFLANPERWNKTTDEWKEVLSGAYFRKLHPKGEVMDFAYFWKHGWGPLFPGLQEENPVPMFLGQRLAPSTFEDTHLRNVIIYDVFLISIKFQFERTNRMLRQGQALGAFEDLFKRDAGIIDFSCHPHPLSSSWLLKLEQHISHWPQFQTVAGPRASIDDGMPGEEEREERMRARLRVYFQGVQDCLRTVPTVFYQEPQVPEYLIEACALL